MSGELTRSQAIVLRELVRAGERYVTAAELAVALDYPNEAWVDRPQHVGTPLACHRAQAMVQRIRSRFGHDVIETQRGVRAAGGYRLGARGWELLGPGVREVVG